MATTVNFAFAKPDVNGSNNAWGGIVNAFMDAIDSVLFAAKTAADAALARAGGTMTGLLGLKTYTETRVDLGSVSGAVALDLATSQHKTLAIGGATTLSVTNVPAGVVVSSLTLKMLNGGSAAVTWPASFDWPGGAAPSLTAAGTDIVAAISYDNGTTWQANALLDVK